MTRRFDGKVALVTGASRGLGRAVAAALAGEGAAVCAVGRDVKSVEETLILLGDKGTVVLADLVNAHSAEDAVRHTVDTLGGLDLLVNVAGIIRQGSVDVFDVDDWDTLFDTNTRASFLTMKYSIPEMRKRGGGAIVNIASIFALASLRGTAAYAASKAAVIALTKITALDHICDGIRINCVAPGTMLTEMFLESAQQRSPDNPKAMVDSVGNLHPIGRLLDPTEVSDLILFLLSDEASAIVGSCFTIDGGRTAALGSIG